MPNLVFHIGHSAGFYSEFNNMVLAILYCQRHDIDFRLYSADANFRNAKGWTDYFLPFCHETRNRAHHFINHRFDAPLGGKRKLLYDTYKYLFPNSYLTSELWDQFRHIDQNELSTAETQQLCAPIIERIYRFNPKTQQSIDSLIEPLNLPDRYIGFHVRGGDKNTEHEILSINQYITKAESKTDLRTAFVYTDDFRFVTALREQYPTWEFLTLTPSTDCGYFHHEFLKLDAATRTQKTINMFASMEVLSRAELSFCTFSSNIGMFLGMRMGDRAVGIDMDHWMIW